MSAPLTTPNEERSPRSDSPANGPRHLSTIAIADDHRLPFPVPLLPFSLAASTASSVPSSPPSVPSALPLRIPPRLQRPRRQPLAGANCSSRQNGASLSDNRAIAVLTRRGLAMSKSDSTGVERGPSTQHPEPKLKPPTVDLYHNVRVTSRLSLSCHVLVIRSRARR